MKEILLLGSTGSIGEQTLDLVRRYPQRYKVKALAAHSRIERLRQQIQEFSPEVVAVADPEAGRSLAGTVPCPVLIGPGGLEELATLPCDRVVSAIVGVAGLAPTLRAVQAGRTVCLANKETLVAAGSLFMEAVRTHNAELLPVDSEHSAIFQCLVGEEHRSLEKILLTASGGPFRGRTREQLLQITPQEALKHPNWSMGGKITIDSATLMNKGLEVLEAHWLFGVELDKIEVVVHPQSIVHSAVVFHDGSLLAQLGPADMRLPIQYALDYPQRLPGPVSPVDLVKLKTLVFEEPDTETFPLLALAYAAGRQGGLAPAVLNGANEVAVAGFLHEEIGFLEIAAVVEEVLSAYPGGVVDSLEAISAADDWARQRAQQAIQERKGRKL